MLYIVEIPHRAAPKCWVAMSQTHFCEVVRELSAFDPVIDNADFEACGDWLRQDLHSLAIYMNEAEAIEALITPVVWQEHQGQAARAALLSKVGKYESGVYEDSIQLITAVMEEAKDYQSAINALEDGEYLASFDRDDDNAFTCAVECAHGLLKELILIRTPAILNGTQGA